MVTAYVVDRRRRRAREARGAEALRKMIAGAGRHPTRLDDLDAIVHVLGHVWFAALAFWVGGMTKAGAMADDLERAAHLLLDR